MLVRLQRCRASPIRLKSIAAAGTSTCDDPVSSIVNGVHHVAMRSWFCYHFDRLSLSSCSCAAQANWLRLALASVKRPAGRPRAVSMDDRGCRGRPGCDIFNRGTTSGHYRRPLLFRANQTPAGCRKGFISAGTCSIHRTRPHAATSKPRDRLSRSLHRTAGWNFRMQFRTELRLRGKFNARDRFQQILCIGMLRIPEQVVD